MRTATIQELEIAALKAETAIASSVAPYRHSAYNVKLRAAALRQVGPSLSRAQVSPVMLALEHGEQEFQVSPVTWPPGHAGAGQDTDDEVQLLSWARQVRADNQARSASSTSQVAPVLAAMSAAKASKEDRLAEQLAAMSLRQDATEAQVQGLSQGQERMEAKMEASAREGREANAALSAQMAQLLAMQRPGAGGAGGAGQR